MNHQTSYDGNTAPIYCTICTSTTKTHKYITRQEGRFSCAKTMNSMVSGFLWIYWKSSRGQPTRGGPPALGLGEVLTTLHRKNISCYKMFTQKASDLDWYFVRPKQWKMDMRFGNWNVRSLYRVGSHTAAVRE